MTVAAASTSQFLLEACTVAPNATAPTTIPAAAPTSAPTAALAPASATGPPTAITPAATARPASALTPNGITLPAYVPVAAVKPDLPGSETIPDGYLQFPRKTFKSVAEKPGAGSDITWMTYTIVPNAARGDNAAWQEVNNQVGANLLMRNAVSLAGEQLSQRGGQQGSSF